MANTVIALKKSATISSTPTSLEFGELAINYADGKIFYKNVNSSIVEFAPSGGGGGNSFGTVNANSTLIVSDTAGDILTLLAGNNISITGDAVNDTITFSANIAPAFDKANSAETIAIAAFNKANTGGGSSNTLPVLISEYKFIGDGSTFSYTLGTGAYSNNVLVFINGVTQSNSAYTFEDANSTAILSEIPAQYDTVFFKVISGSGSGGTGGGTQDNTIANSAFDKANAANIIASLSFNTANAANIIASLSFNTANASNVVAVAAFNKANTPNNSFISSNTANAAAGVTLTTTANGISFTDGNFATAGDAVVNHYILRGTTTSTAEVELLVDGTTSIPIRTNTTMMYTIDAVGRRTDATGYGAAITIKGAADNFSGTTADIGTIYEVIVARDSASYTIDARSNNTTDVLNIYAAGATGNTVRWVAYVTTVEVSQ